MSVTLGSHLRQKDHNNNDDDDDVADDDEGNADKVVWKRNNNKNNNDDDNNNNSNCEKRDELRFFSFLQPGGVNASGSSFQPSPANDCCKIFSQLSVQMKCLSDRKPSCLN